MKKASDYIIFPLDVPTLDDARRFVELLAEDVGLFKVGLELFIRSGSDIIEFIKSKSSARIFLDLKLHDIPATVGRAMASIAELGVAFATVHVGESRRMLEAAVEASQGQVGVFGVTVLTSVSSPDLKSAGYREEIYTDMTGTVIRRAKLAKEAGCAGVIGASAKPGNVPTCSGLVIATCSLSLQRSHGSAMRWEDCRTTSSTLANGWCWLKRPFSVLIDRWQEKQRDDSCCASKTSWRLACS